MVFSTTEKELLRGRSGDNEEMLRLFRLLIVNVVDDVEDAVVDDEVDGSEGGGCGYE